MGQRDLIIYLERSLGIFSYKNIDPKPQLCYLDFNIDFRLFRANNIQRYNRTLAMVRIGLSH